MGYVPDRAITNWAKVLGVAGAGRLQLENFGMLYPHLPLYALLPFAMIPPLRTDWAPFIVSSVYGAITLTVLHGRLMRAGYSIAAALAAGLLVCTHPFFIRAVVTGTNQSASLLVFLLIAMGLMQLRTRGDARAYMLAGLSLALFFFVDERAVYIAVALLPVLLLFPDDEVLHQSPGGIYTVMLTPFMFSLLAWVYMNWLFLQNPLAFVQDRRSAFLGARMYGEFVPWLNSFGGRPLAAMTVLIVLGLLAVPAGAVLVARSLHGRSMRVRVAALFAIPVAAAIISTWTQYLEHPVDFLFLLLVPLMIGVSDVPRQLRSSPLLLGALIMGHVGGIAVLAYRPSADTNRFLRAAALQQLPDAFSSERQLGVALIGLKGVMIDDRRAFPAIAARNSGAWLALPFSDEFKLAMASGEISTPYVAVPERDRAATHGDAIAERFPDLYEKGHPDYTLVYDEAGWRIYRRVSK